uniref:Low-density lipoprotein receptor domain class A n=1 Tax=Parascaris univalens TaxID=6257 RepID=A0A915AN56_PARUN
MASSPYPAFAAEVEGHKGKCAEGEFRCENGNECLPIAYVLDGIAQCSDKSDEVPPNPGDCADLQRLYKSSRSGVFTAYDSKCANPMLCKFSVHCDMEIFGGGWTDDQSGRVPKVVPGGDGDADDQSGRVPKVVPGGDGDAVSKAY